MNKKNIKDLSIWKHTCIGPWFSAVQKSNISKHMRDKSHRNKGKQLRKKTRGSNKSTNSKKRKMLYFIYLRVVRR